jgi:hypothetical protein
MALKVISLLQQNFLLCDLSTEDVSTKNLMNFDSKNIDFQIRGMDSHLVSNINAPFDLVAEETEGSDIILLNSFKE